MDFDRGIQVNRVPKYYPDAGRKEGSVSLSAMNYNNIVKRTRLPREQILRKDQDIKNILDSGIRKNGAYLTIYYENSSEKKFAVLVPRKSGNAVNRNRGKRVIREIYRLNPGWFYNMRIVILLKQVNINYKTLKMEIKKLLVIQ